MPVKIEINQQDAEDLIDFYVEKQKKISDQISGLETSLVQINEKIIELKQILKGEFAQNNTFPESTYSAKWNWVKKITFAIEIAGKPLTTKEIVDVLTDYDPNYIINRKTAIASVSATISAKSGPYEHYKDFIKIPADWGDYSYDVWREKVIESENKVDITGENLNKSVGSNIGDDLPF
jgi:hypothetical protein